MSNSNALPKDHPDALPHVRNITEARTWIQEMHRRTVQDAQRIADLYERLARLERRRWWHRRSS